MLLIIGENALLYHCGGMIGCSSDAGATKEIQHRTEQRQLELLAMVHGNDGRGAKLGDPLVDKCMDNHFSFGISDQNCFWPMAEMIIACKQVSTTSRDGKWFNEIEMKVTEASVRHTKGSNG